MAKKQKSKSTAAPQKPSRKNTKRAPSAGTSGIHSELTPEQQKNLDRHGVVDGDGDEK
ncbi:MAG: hypothetical protein WCT04_06295 [Planctomycetota bacterium]